MLKNNKGRARKQYSHIILQIGENDNDIVETFRRRLESKPQRSIALTTEENINQITPSHDATIFVVSHGRPGSPKEMPNYFNTLKDYIQRNPEIKNIKLVSCHSALNIESTNSKVHYEGRITSKLSNPSKSTAQSLSEYLESDINIYGYIGAHFEEKTKSRSKNNTNKTHSYIEINSVRGQDIIRASSGRACFVNGKLTEMPKISEDFLLNGMSGEVLKCRVSDQNAPLKLETEVENVRSSGRCR